MRTRVLCQWLAGLQVSRNASFVMRKVGKQRPPSKYSTRKARSMI